MHLIGARGSTRSRDEIETEAKLLWPRIWPDLAASETARSLNQTIRIQFYTDTRLSSTLYAIYYDLVMYSQFRKK